MPHAWVEHYSKTNEEALFSEQLELDNKLAVSLCIICRLFESVNFPPKLKKRKRVFNFFFCQVTIKVRDTSNKDFTLTWWAIYLQAKQIWTVKRLWHVCPDVIWGGHLQESCPSCESCLRLHNLEKPHSSNTIQHKNSLLSWTASSFTTKKTLMPYLTFHVQNIYTIYYICLNVHLCIC